MSLNPPELWRGNKWRYQLQQTWEINAQGQRRLVAGIANGDVEGDIHVLTEGRVNMLQVPALEMQGTFGENEGIPVEIPIYSMPVTHLQLHTRQELALERVV